MGYSLLALWLALLVWIIVQLFSVVPSAIGMTESRSLTLIEDAGFRTKVTTVAAGDILAGRVIAQTPAPGLQLVFRPVHLTVAAGTALSGGGAPSAVTDSGDYTLAIGVEPTVTPPSDAEEMEPLFVPGTATQRLMPDVLFLPQSEAEALITAAGLTAEIKRAPSTTNVASGHLFYQNPTPGSLVELGQTATIWVSTGPLNLLDAQVDGDYPRPAYP